MQFGFIHFLYVVSSYGVIHIYIYHLCSAWSAFTTGFSFQPWWQLRGCHDVKVCHIIENIFPQHTFAIMKPLIAGYCRSPKSFPVLTAPASLSTLRQKHWSSVSHHIHSLTQNMSVKSAQIIVVSRFQVENVINR